MQKHRLFLLMIAGSSLLAFLPAACGTSSSSSDGGSSNSALSAAFTTNCARCHGATGAGGSGINLQGYPRSKAAFESRVRTGGGSMPAFAATDYSDTDLMADYTHLISQ